MFEHIEFGRNRKCQKCASKSAEPEGDRYGVFIEQFIFRASRFFEFEFVARFVLFKQFIVVLVAEFLQQQFVDQQFIKHQQFRLATVVE